MSNSKIVAKLRTSTPSKPPVTIQISPFEHKKDPTFARNQNFICLCKKCVSKSKCEYSAFKICTNTLFGVPLHSFLAIIALNLVLITAFLLLLSSTISIKTVNNRYYSPCSSNSDCDSTLGLHCSTQVSVCNCPARNTIGKCDCNQGNYWNGSKCATVSNYQSECTHDFNCDTTKRLTCINGICSCAKPRIWLNTTLTCDYSYLGCYNDNYTNSMFAAANNNSRMAYFVETCASYCSALGIKYALVSSEKFNLCYCQSTFTNAIVLLCGNYCPGITAAGYLCGIYSQNSFSIKSVYLVN
jgi:hypothetical protein